MARLAIASILLVMMSCGSPRAGDACSTTGYVCADSDTGLECRQGQWVPLPCKGSGGCTRDSNVIRCDMSGNVQGDLCATSAEGKGLCSKDGLSTLECRGGTLKTTHTCKSCSVVGDNIVCQT